jgi:CDP-diacylglycerol--serine O-phosphatidyltransferase
MIMKKIIRAIPSFITSMNLVCGAIATIMALHGEVRIAIILIICAAVFDFFDGFAARLLNMVSDFGKQMDSLADVISFGFAPAALLYNLIITNEILPGYFPLIAVFITVFSALRLAKFNIDTEQAAEFRGLPTPASALLLISICWYCNDYDNNITEFLKTNYVIIILIIGLSALMVSRIKLLSLKIKSFGLKSNLWQLILISGTIVLLITFKILGIGLVIILYISLSIFKQLISKK